MSEVNKLSQTVSAFKVRGKVTRIDKDNAFKQDVMKEGHRREGENYRALQFGVKTSDDNEVFVSSFDYEPKEVFLWHSEKAKEAKEKKKKFKGIKIPFTQWEEEAKDLRKDGWSVLQSRVGIERDKKGKIISHGLPRYVAQKLIYEGINNGDSVVVEGKIRYSRYTNADDKVIEKTDYAIERLFKLDDIDFGDEKYEEISYFEQEMVFVDVELNKKENRAVVIGRTIDYQGKHIDTEFIIDFNDGDGEGGVDKSMEKLAKVFRSKLKFGDVINVFGEILNKVIIVENEDEDLSEEDEILALMGGRSKPKHAEKWTSKDYITEMRIFGVDSWDKKVYKEEDFEIDELIDNEFGGKQKPKGGNPFKVDEDDTGLADSSSDDDDDDLPF